MRSQVVHLAAHSGRFRWHSASIWRDGGKHVILPGVFQEHLLGMGREGLGDYRERARVGWNPTGRKEKASQDHFSQPRA